MSRPKTRKAVVVHKCSEDIFTAANLEESPLPEVKSNEVLVKMLAAPINPSDYMNIAGSYGKKATCPFVVGFEGVGEIVEAGSDVKSVAVGDWVLPGKSGLGTWLEYGVFNSDHVFKIDKSVGFKAAATMIVNPCTAYFLLRDVIKLESGQTIIQNGANSYVGKTLIQIAKSMGVKTINVVRKRANLADLVKELTDLGADRVVTDEELQTVEFEEKPILAIDCVAGEAASLLLKHLPPGGTLVNYGALSMQPISASPLDLIFKGITVRGYWLVNSVSDGKRLGEEAIPFLAKLAASGKLKLPEFELFMLSDFKKGLERATAGFTNKKQMLIMDPALME